MLLYFIQKLTNNYKSMLKQLASNPNPGHFIAYSLAFVIYGSVITGLGPLIPYFTNAYHHDQTQYSFLFLCRAGGIITAGFLVKILQRFLTLHQIIISAAGFIGVFSVIFTYCTQMFSMGLYLYFMSVGCGCMEITITMSLLAAHINNDQQFWVQLGHGMFGVGGLIGPIVVYLLELYSYMGMGIAFMLLTPIFLYYKSPETRQFMKSLTQNGDEEEREKNKSPEEKSHSIENPVPRHIQILIQVMFFLYIGIEVSFGGWISSFAVMKDVSTKEQATSFSSIFWFSVTIFRFFLAFAPGKTSTKLINCAIGSLICSIIGSISCFYDYDKFAIIFSSIFLGLFYAPVFPLLFTIPTEYNMELKVHQIANIMIAASIGQALLSTLVGYLMGLISSNMLFHSLTIFGIIYLAVGKKLIKIFQESMVTSDTNTKLLGGQTEMKYFTKKGKISDNF